MSLLSIGEEIYLRVLTGKIVGENILDGVNRVALVIYPDRICSAMSAATLSSFIGKVGYKENIGMVYLYKEDFEKLKANIKKYDALMLLFGGEQRISEVVEEAVETIRFLKDIKYYGILIFHTRTFIATDRLFKIIENKDLMEYLSKLKEIRTFTVDLDNKKFVFNRIKIKDGKIELEKFNEVQLTEEHISLLKKSLPKK